MVMRSHTTVEMQLEVEGNVQAIVRELRNELGNRYSVSIDSDGRRVII